MATRWHAWRRYRAIQCEDAWHVDKRWRFWLDLTGSIATADVHATAETSFRRVVLDL